jgi:hypothetical protein
MEKRRRLPDTARDCSKPGEIVFGGVGSAGSRALFTSPEMQKNNRKILAVCAALQLTLFKLVHEHCAP